MAKAILLTGSPQSGKTTLIKRIVSHMQRPAVGFYTQEIRESGRRVGFEMVTMDGRKGVLAHLGLRGQARVGRYGVDLSVIDALGVDCLKKALSSKKLVVVDEIGPMEILSDQFRHTLLDLLESDALLIGSIVNRKNRFADPIKSRPDVVVIEVRRENHEAVFNQVTRLIREMDCCGVRCSHSS